MKSTSSPSATNSQAFSSRREFLKNAVIAGSVLAAPAILPGHLFAQENAKTLRIGLVGCGGRGSGAASNALRADKNIELVAMGDAFDDRIQSSLKNLKASPEGEQVNHLADAFYATMR